ncbi:hypothetical protein JCM8547_001938 [Rhodosporidiobolus lusitaniae]
MSSLARNANQGLDLSNTTAAVSGATGGIGAAVAFRFAQAGANVFVIGRNTQRGSEVVEQLKAAGGEGKTFEFIQADLSSPKEAKRVADELKAKTGAKGIDFLVQAQGGPPNGSLELTKTDPPHDAHFAVQTLSRFSLAFFLASSGTLKQGWINILAPSGTNGPEPDVDDIELMKDSHRSKYLLGRVMAQGAQDGALGDAMVAHFPRVFPHLQAYHLFPGFVPTGALGSMNLFPRPLVWAVDNFLGPLMARTPIGNSPESYANIPVYVAANPAAQGKGLEFTNQALKPLGMPKWAEQEKGGLAEKVWEKLKGIVEREA